MISRLRSMVTAVALFTLLAVLVLWGLSLQLQNQLREQVLAREELRSQQLADAMAGQTEALFHLLDLGLLDLRGHWKSPGDSFEAERRRVFDSLPPGLVSHMTVVDAQGLVVYNSLGAAVGTYVGDRDYFQAMRSGGDHLVLGAPVRSRLNGQWLFVLARPVYRDGRFAGGLHLAVSTSYLARLLGRLALSDNDLVGLVHPGGLLLARSLDNESAMGQSVPADRPFLLDPGAERGTFRLDGAVDGVSRLYGWQRLRGTGAVVVVGLSESAVLSPLEMTRRDALLLTALLSLALAGIGAWIGWLLLKVERGRDRLERSEARLKSAQQMARVGHWELDLSQNRLSWSDEVFRLFGQSAGTYTPTADGFMSAVHPEDVAALRQAFDWAVAQRVPLDHVHRIVLPDGGVRHVRLLCEMDFSDGQPTRYHGTVQDITELRETQRALEQLNAGLEQRVKARTHELVVLNRDLESFTYSVSHDLRTPLRSIHGFATVLGETEADRLSDEGRSFLARIQEGARRMGLLINDLLSMAQQSRAELKVQPINLTDLAQAVAADLARTDPARQVHWAIEDGLSVQADPGLVTVVMQNLLGNAWKYTGNKAEAEISLTSCGEADGMVTFCLRDNGAGFDMRYVDQLFHPFKRLHRQDEFEGTGVGLASVQRILQRHGGSVRGEGVVGQGAVFHFSLPVDPVRQFGDSVADGR